MTRGLAAERVRRDVEVLARAGLGLDAFLTESLASLQRALPFDAVCLGTMDPSTGLLTGSHKVGALQGIETFDHEWGLVERPPSPRAAACARRTACGSCCTPSL